MSKTTSFLLVSSFRNKEKRRKQGNYLCGCFIQLASDTNGTHATRVTTLWLKQPNLFLSVIYSYGIVFIDKMADFSARSQSIRFSLVCAP